MIFSQKYIVIESDVFLNSNLTNTEKILYGHIVALSQNDKGCCFMSTENLCKLMNIKKRQLNYSLAKLKSFNYISTLVIKNKRYITPTINKFLDNRKNENKEKEFFDYDWLNEEK